MRNPTIEGQPKPVNLRRQLTQILEPHISLSQIQREAFTIFGRNIRVCQVDSLTITLNPDSIPLYLGLYTSWKDSANLYLDEISRVAALKRSLRSLKTTLGCGIDIQLHFRQHQTPADLRKSLLAKDRRTGIVLSGKISQRNGRGTLITPEPLA